MGKDLDVIVFGATGDAGSACVRMLYNFAGQESIAISSWGVAGRNEKKLKALIDSLPQGGTPPAEVIIADVGDYESLCQMARKAKVVIACVGPYMQFGEQVVKACVETGTHYVDVTGEVAWVAKMRTTYGEEAKAKGLYICPMSGYDSVPSDISCYLADEAIRKQTDGTQRLGKLESYHHMRGGVIPDGTLKTAIAMINASKRKMLRKIGFGVKSSSTSDTKKKSTKGRSSFVPSSEAVATAADMKWNSLQVFSGLSGCFSPPHFMASINIPAVHDTAASLGYGGFQYRERLLLSSWESTRSARTLFGLLPSILFYTTAIFFSMLVVFPGFDKLLPTVVGIYENYLNPTNKGKIAEANASGKGLGGFTVNAMGSDSRGGNQVHVYMSSRLDAGLGFTGLMSAIVAGTIVESIEKGGNGNGFSSPVAGLGGEVIATRLQKAPHIKLKVEAET